MLLKWCPVCFQKLLLVLKDSDNIGNLQSSGEENHCMMCKNSQYVVDIENWSHLVKILEEFGEVDGTNMCLNCIYILDLRYTIKQKVCSRYVSLLSNYY